MNSMNSISTADEINRMKSAMNATGTNNATDTNSATKTEGATKTENATGSESATGTNNATGTKSANAREMISGADAIVRCLESEGVEVVFGYPGAAVLPLYSALSASGIKHVLTRSEQGAGHAASGFARITGRPGVCIATSGPGATNLFTAIATAYSDSIPMVAITGQVATYNLGRDVFQEVDTTGAVEPFTKYSYLVKSAADIGRVFKEAFHISSTGRKGPVLIDVPMDVQQEPARFAYPETVDIRGYKPSYSGNALQIKRVAEAVGAAQRPLLCLGGGVFLAGAQNAAREFSERVNLPVVTTLMGIGALPWEHPLNFGMIGQSGGSAANYALSHSDLLILIGARVGDRAINKPAELTGAAIVHIDIDPAEIGKNMGTTIPLVGDAARVLEQLAGREIAAARPEWIVELDAMRRAEGEEFTARPERTASVDPVKFARGLSGMLPDDAVYVADVGQNQIWSAKNFVSHGRFLTTGGMGTMGYSIPAAIGAQLADPSRTVIAMLGDGAFQMSMNELATVVRLKLPIKIVLINNGKLGLVRELQQVAGTPEFAVDLDGSPDYGKLAAAYGVEYSRASGLGQAIEAARAMLEHNGAYLLECAVDPEESTS